jgi:hypothetical protein
MLDTCNWVRQNGIEGLAPFECVPRMLIVSACFVQALGPIASGVVAEAIPFFLESEPGSPVWSAALIVLLSGIIVAVFAPEPLADLVNLVDLTSWFAFGASPGEFFFDRLSVMSIAGFMVLAMAGNELALPTFVHQMGSLASAQPDRHPDTWEQLPLPFDAIDIAVLLSNFSLDYGGSWASADRSESDRAARLPPREHLASPGFCGYLRRFNLWLPPTETSGDDGEAA